MVEAPGSSHLVKVAQVVVPRHPIVLLAGLHRCKAHCVVGHVKLCVETADEDVAKDPEWTHGSGYIQTNEATDADSLTQLLHL